MKNLLILSGTYPAFSKGKQAANYTTFQIIDSLLKKKKFKIYFMRVGDKAEFLSNKDKKDIDVLKKKGVFFFRDFICKNLKNSLALKICKLVYDPKSYFIGYQNKDRFKSKINNYKFDCTLTVWSEISTQLISHLNLVKKIAYYGNVDNKIIYSIWRIRLYLKKISYFKYFFFLIFFYRLIKKGHFEIIKKIDWVFDFAKNDSIFYKKNFVKSSYCPIIWKDKNKFTYKKIVSKRNKIKSNNHLKLLAGVGNLNGTANTLGLITLIDYLLPIMIKKIKADSFLLNIYGSGILEDKFNFLKNSKYFKFHGFVDNLDHQYFKNHFTVIPQSFQYLKVSHTRVLHAWSMGSPIVAFNDLSISMPELKNGFNCLLSSNPNEFVENINKLLESKELESNLIRNGLLTLKNKFNPDIILEKIYKKLI